MEFVLKAVTVVGTSLLSLWIAWEHGSSFTYIGVGASLIISFAFFGYAVPFKTFRFKNPFGQTDRLEFTSNAPSRLQEVQGAFKQFRDDALQPLREAKAPKAAAVGQRARVKVSPLQAEAQAIDTFLSTQLNLAVEIHWRQKSAITVTPYHILYRLDPEGTKPFPLAALTNSADAVARFLGTTKLRRGFTQPIVARVIATQPAYLQVTHPKPEIFTWAAREWKSRPLATPLGDVWDGPTRRNVVLDIKGADAYDCHGLFCGSSGSGKTVGVHSALLGLLDGSSAKQLQVFAVDTNANAYAAYANLPQIAETVSAPVDVLPLLNRFAGWCTADGKPSDSAHRLLILDEFQALSTDPMIGDEVVRLLVLILSQGRKYGIRVWLVTQDPSKTNLPTGLKNLLQFYVVYLSRRPNYLRDQMKFAGVDKLAARTEAIIRTSQENDTIATTYWLTEKDRANEIAKLEAKYPPSVPTHPVGSAVPLAQAVGASATFPLAQARELTPAETADAVALLRAQREAMQYHGAWSKARVSVALYGKANNETKRLAGIVIASL